MKIIDTTAKPQTHQTRMYTKKTNYVTKRKIKKRKRHPKLLWTLAIFCIIFALTTEKGGNLLDSIVNNISISQGTPKLKRYAKEHGLLLSDYPQKLIELYERNPETKHIRLY